MLRYWPILLWLIYFFSPFDLIPDFIPGFGRLDDLLLLGYLYWAFMRKNPASSSRPGKEEGAAGSRSGPFGNGTERNAEGAWTAQKPRTRDPYRILKVERSASLGEIKQAYRLQASRYHPDKVAHLGEEFQALAKEKFQDIQWAYERLVRERA